MKALIIFFIVVALAIIGFFIYDLSIATKLQGDYLIAGIYDMCRLQHSLGKTTVERLASSGCGKLLYGRECTLRFKGKRAEFKYYGGTYILEPSSTINGDWDLIKYKPHYGAVQEYANPEVSYLHKIREPAISQGFDYLAQEKCDKALDIFGDLYEKDKQDPFITTLYICALYQLKKYEEAEKLLPALKSLVDEKQLNVLNCPIRKIEHNIRAGRLSAAGKNAFDYFAKFSKHRPDEHYMDFVDKGINCDEYLAPAPLQHWQSIPRSFALRIMAKVMRTEAMLALIGGTKEECLSYLLKAHRVGQLVQADPSLMEKLIGTAIKAISIGGLNEYLNDLPLTAEEVKDFWEQLDILNKKEKSYTIYDVLQYVPEFYSEKMLSPFVIEPLTRLKASEARFKLLRAATAAKYVYLSTGQYPSKAAEFVPLLPQGPPADPFTSQALSINKNLKFYTLYSFGPDATDNQGELLYDPTNGTISPGDLIIQVR